MMRKSLFVLMAGIALGSATAGAKAQPLTEIKISYQPAVYWALPFYAGEQKGWYAEMGLKPVFFAAAFLCHLHATGDPRAAADFANRVAAISVEHTGASGIPTHSEVTARFG